MLRTIFQRGMALLGLAALGGCATPPAAETAANAGKPAMWQVSDKDTTVYLFGTIHVLPQNYDWRTPAFDKAVAGSQDLVVETIVDLQRPETMAATVQRLGFSSGLSPLSERVPADLRPQLQAAIAESKIPAAAFDQMETWLAAVTFIQLRLQQLGLEGKHGVEEVLKQQFTSGSKPIGQLETNAEQLGYFDTLPEDAQVELLKGAIESKESFKAELDTMLASWARGDVMGIAKSFDANLVDVPALREALISRRNANWSNWVERRMATPGTTLVAVGAGHLAGSDSVVAMLERDGYRVRRVQ
ncbi:MAG TPA: TraB/GumN family protein [Sphingomicrobium sp.]